MAVRSATLLQTTFVVFTSGRQHVVAKAFIPHVKPSFARRVVKTEVGSVKPAFFLAGRPSAGS